MLSLEHVGEHGFGNHFNTMPDASVANVGSITHQNKKPHINTLHTKHRCSQDASSPCRCSKTRSGEMRKIKTSVSRTPRWYHNTQKDFHMVICHSSNLALNKNGTGPTRTSRTNTYSCFVAAVPASLLLLLLCCCYLCFPIAFTAWLLLLVLCCKFCCLCYCCCFCCCFCCCLC